MLMLEMAEEIPNGTLVLLYRPLGDNDVTVGEVVERDPETGTYGITDNNGTTEMMRPGLDFVVPERGVRVVDTTEDDATAQILDVVTYDDDICLDVKYDDEELEHSPLYDVEDNYLENFKYAGLPRMNVGQLVKVYPSRYWNVNVNPLDAGAIGVITRENVDTQGLYFVQMRESYGVQALQRVFKVRRDEAMPYNEDVEEKEAEEAGVDPEPPVQRQAVFQRENVPAGLYVCDDQGYFRHLPKACALCLQEKQLIACVPCGHRIMCQACYNKLTDRRCPVCRTPIQSTLMVWDRNAQLPEVKCGNRYCMPLN